MRQTDIAIVGGGLAGSLAAAMLGRSGIDALLIDPHPSYPPDFRCEKLDEAQLEILGRTGLAEEILTACAPYRENWVARFGHIVEKRRGNAQGVMYDTLVNSLRALRPAHTPLVVDKVVDIDTGADQQRITLSNGESVLARLVILATGLNIGLRSKLGIERTVTSPNHSIAAAFDVEAADGRPFKFPALTYFAERPSDQMAYISFFPVRGTMRANLFGYRDLHDPWMRELRHAPQETLFSMWPALRGVIGEFRVSGRIHIRPVDLYTTRQIRRDGIVVVGDAYSTSCPAAGTGARKVLTDVERLCNVHIPLWLASPGMDGAKIDGFYADPLKLDCDAFSVTKAFELKAFSTSHTLRWAFLRWAKFFAQAGRGALGRMAGSAVGVQPLASEHSSSHDLSATPAPLYSASKQRA